MTDHAWNVHVCSVRGRSHQRTGTVIQDKNAKQWCNGAPILTISDGHGSATSFRSHLGARMAAEVARRSLRSLLSAELSNGNFSAVKRHVQDKLPQGIVYRWRKKVSAHLAEHPFNETELLPLETGKRQAVEKNPFLAYGATLLGVAVTTQYIIYLQLGDGDILAVSDAGEVSRPFQKDERLIANETTSLCAPKEAWKDMQVRFEVIDPQQVTTPPPALILVSTDGYANSFRDEASFLQVGRDVWDMVRDEGFQIVKDNMRAWIAEASQVGSGDDITLGILCRKSAFAIHEHETDIVE